jgi:hypothetical protein
VLKDVSRSLEVSHEEAFQRLKGAYETASTEWGVVAGTLNIASQRDAWISPLLAGLLAYGQAEGY